MLYALLILIVLLTSSSSSPLLFAQQQPFIFNCSQQTQPNLLIDDSTTSTTTYSNGIKVLFENGCQSITIKGISLASLSFGLINATEDSSLVFSPLPSLTVADCSFFLSFSSTSAKKSDISFDPTVNWRYKFGNIRFSNTKSTWNLPQTHTTSISFMDFPLSRQDSSSSSSSTGTQDFRYESLSFDHVSLSVTSTSTTNTATAPEVSLLSTSLRQHSSSSASSSSSSSSSSARPVFTLGSTSTSSVVQIQNCSITVSDALRDKSSDISFLLVRNGTNIASSTTLAVRDSIIEAFARRTKSAQFIRLEDETSWSSKFSSSASSILARLTSLSSLKITLRAPPTTPSQVLLSPPPHTSLLTLRGEAPSLGSIDISDIVVSMPEPAELKLASAEEDKDDGEYKFYLLNGLSSQGTFASSAQLIWRFTRISLSVFLTTSQIDKPDSEKSTKDDSFVQIFGFKEKAVDVDYLRTGDNSTFIFTNFSWTCAPIQQKARSLLENAPLADTSSSSIVDECTFTPPERRSSFASDLKEGAAAFFSTAVLSAASMSAVAFGLSRSQEVGEFVGLAATGSCIAANSTEVPIFSDSPLGLELSPELCGYYGGTIAGNFALFGIATFVSLFFGSLGACVKKKGFDSIYRVLNNGYFGVVATCSIGLFLTPTIQHATLCAAREGGHIGARVGAGIIATLLFFAIPIWSYVVLIHNPIHKKGVLIDDRLQESTGKSVCCPTKKACGVGSAWRYLFGIREWKFNSRGGYLSNILAGRYNEHRKKNPKKDPTNLTVVRSNFDGDEIDSGLLLQVGGMNSGQVTGNVLGFKQKPDGSASAGDEEEVILEQKFKALRPLFEDYDERFSSFFFIEVLTNALLGLPSLIAEFIGPDSNGGKNACWGWGVPIAVILFFYWFLLVFKRPIQCRIMLLANFAVSGLQLLLTCLAIYTVTLGPDSAPSWGEKIDIALLIAQAALSIVGIMLSLRAVWNGGLAKIRNCLCPRKEDDDAVEAVMREENTFMQDERTMNEMAAIANASYHDDENKTGDDKDVNKKKKNDDVNTQKKHAGGSSKPQQQNQATAEEDEIEIDLNVDDVVEEANDEDDDVPPPSSSVEEQQSQADENTNVVSEADRDIL